MEWKDRSWEYAGDEIDVDVVLRPVSCVGLAVLRLGIS